MRRQKGFIVSIELMFLATILVIGLLAGWVMLRDNVLGELQDVANAIGSVNQSFTYNGTTEVSSGDTGSGIELTKTSGALFVDGVDESDMYVINVGVTPDPAASEWNVPATQAPVDYIPIPNH